MPEMYDYNRKAYRNSALALEQALSTNEYLINNTFSVTDIIVGWTCHFGQGLDYHEGYDSISAYVKRLMARPHCTLPVE